ncbi:MAG: acyl-CoA reductase [Bacteroidota bacterium]
MTVQDSVLEAFVKLGKFFKDFCENQNNGQGIWFERLEKTVTECKEQNGWFTKDNVRFALSEWGKLLSKEQLQPWLLKYDATLGTPSKVAIIMAGNIPLVGFHDFLCVLLTGNSVIAKLSSNDQLLLPFVRDYLIALDPIFEEKIYFEVNQLKDYDAVIATGSNNTGRYFEYYFGKKPHIIRKNRSSIAVLKGTESKLELTKLGRDIFQYFGLGCRNVSKIFVPVGYDLNQFFEAIFAYATLIENHKYANNYDYNKAVYLMGNDTMLDNGFLLLKEDRNNSSPIGTLFYEYYSDLSALKKRIRSQKNELQCIVSRTVFDDEVGFGETQSPKLDDYADGIDTIVFLQKL